MSDRYVGRPVARREDARLLSGRTRYLDDVRLPDVAHVAIVRSPHAHARITRIEAEEASRAAGVVAVVTGADVAAATRPFTTRIPGLRPVVYHALAGDRVRFVGEPVAAVVAESRLAAEDAAERVVVDWEPLPAVAAVGAALAPGAPRLYQDWPDNVLVRHEFSIGDVDAAFAGADVVIRETFESHRQTALPLELRGAVAAWDGRTLTVWSSTQVPHVLRTVLADVLGMAEASIRVIAPDVGGGFGMKYQVHREEALVAWLARRVGRPVKWREDIREHLAAGTHAREQTITLALAARGDGVIEAMRATVVGDVGSAAAFPSSHGPVMVIATTAPLGLRVERFASTFECVVTNKCPAGAYRGFGNPVRVLAVERCLDLLAARLGLDPAEVRRRNLVRRGDLPYRGVTGARIASGTLIEAMDRALELAEYPRRRAEQQAARLAGRLVGIGIAAFAEGTAPSLQGLTGSFGAWDACRIRVEPDGRVTAAIGVSPQGQGHETTVAQVLADALGVTPDEIVVAHSDTATTPLGLGAWGSRSALVATGAALEAARRVREKVLAIAGHLLEASPRDLTIDDGRIGVVGGGGRTLTLSEVARAAYTGRGRLPAGMEPGLEATAYVEPPAIDARPDALGRAMRYGAIANAAHVAVVEVDRESGTVHILDYVVVHDCGTIINPVIVEGQIRGGVAQGIAGVLHEAIVYDAGGQLVTGTLMDYHLPKASELPRIRIAHLESPDPGVPGGVKGVGEGGTIGATAAVANAVADALAPLGVRLTRTPLTPPIVWQAISGATREESEE